MGGWEQRGGNKDHLRTCKRERKKQEKNIYPALCEFIWYLVTQEMARYLGEVGGYKYFSAYDK